MKDRHRKRTRHGRVPAAGARRRSWPGWPIAVALLTACAAPAEAPPATTAPEAAARRAYDTEAGRFIGFDRLVAELAPADVILFGEQHDDPGTHRAQLDLLEALAERRDEIVLSLEMFERDVQPVLDAYLSGWISEAEFLADARPWANYATDYRPLVELAKGRGWPVVAANVPRPIAARVVDAGLAVLDTLPRGERELVAREVSCPRDAYYERFVEAMGTHPGAAADGGAAERFYEAQCVKDETMAESIARALAAHPGAVVVHLTGAFHVEYGQGTAPRVERRVPEAGIEIVSAVPVAELDRPRAAEHRDRADHLIFTPAPDTGDGRADDGPDQSRPPR